MAKAQPVWETFYGCCSAAGNRDVLIISSSGKPQGSHIVPRCNNEITEARRKKLINQGIPPDCDFSDDLSIIRARIDLDSTLELVRVLVSEVGKELSRSDVLEQIKIFLRSTKKPGGIIYYCGNGKRNTGDWCFSDGFVTFDDITTLYNSFFKGQVLTIVTDCSYSGNWVKACSQYLDEQGVQPCGHSAKDKGIFLKVYASCKPTEVAATLCFSVQAAHNDKNKGIMSYYLGEKIKETQHSFGLDFTRIRCGKKFEEPCALSPKYTWHTWNENQRVFLVRGNDRGRPAWHYVLLVDDEETIKIFKQKTQAEAAGTHTIDINDYGQVLKSGWGKDPPNKIKDWIDQTYHFTCD